MYVLRISGLGIWKTVRKTTIYRHPPAGKRRIDFLIDRYDLYIRSSGRTTAITTRPDREAGSYRAGIGGAIYRAVLFIKYNRTLYNAGHHFDRPPLGHWARSIFNGRKHS